MNMYNRIMETKYRNFFTELKARFMLGKITYDEAKAEALPYLSEMNTRGQAIATKYNKKFRPFSFAGLFR